MKHTFLIGLCFVNFLICLTAQNEKRANIWYFGNKNGIDFNTNPPSPLLDSEMESIEGTSTICDTLGNLLIYTNGEKIWNRNHQIMVGGEDLGGHQSTTQSSIIVPDSYQPNILYIFALNENDLDLPGSETGQLYYTVVDMDLNNGLGGVVSTRNLMATNCTEKLTAIRHCNKKDFWIITHELGNNNFLVWQLGESGVDPIPRKIDIGTVHQAVAGHGTGTLKGAPLGNKLAITSYVGDFVELFDFDTETGNISRPILFNSIFFSSPYGLAFSPNSKRLYATNFFDSLLLQVDLDLPTTTEIKNSLKIIATISSGSHGAIQNGPDGKLYINAQIAPRLAVVHEPNELGLACNFVANEFDLGGELGGVGLPNFAAIYFRERDTIEVIEANEDCEGIRTLNAIVNIGGDSVVYQWYYENELIPNASSTRIEIENNGSYEFKALVFDNCKTVLKEFTDTISVDFEDFSPLSIAGIEVKVASCNEANGSLTILGEGGIGTLTHRLNEGQFQDENTFAELAEGDYVISVMDERLCSISQVVTVDQFTIPEFKEIDTHSTLCGDASGSLTMEVDGGFGQLNVLFDEEVISNSLIVNNLEAGAYLLSVIDETGCRVDSTVVITQFNCPFYIPNSFSPNGDGLNDFFEINTHPDFDGLFQALEVYDRWGNQVFNAQNLDNTQYQWNGEFRGKQMPIGTYFYILQFNYFEKETEMLTGVINLVR